MNRKVTFSAEERKRLANVCIALGTTFQEFCHFATMQAVDECEGLARDQKLISAYYENHSIGELMEPENNERGGVSE